MLPREFESHPFRQPAPCALAADTQRQSAPPLTSQIIPWPQSHGIACHYPSREEFFSSLLDAEWDAGGRPNHTDTRVRLGVRQNGRGASLIVHRNLEIRRSTPVNAHQKQRVVSSGQHGDVRKGIVDRRGSNASAQLEMEQLNAERSGGRDCKAVQLVIALGYDDRFKGCQGLLSPFVEMLFECANLACYKYYSSLRLSILKLHNPGETRLERGRILRLHVVSLV